MGYGDGIIKELVGYLAGIKLIIILRVSIIIIRFPNACSTAKDRSMSHECVVIVWLRILLNIGYTPLGSLCTDGRTLALLAVLVGERDAGGPGRRVVQPRRAVYYVMHDS